jgi:hypothetical protein
MSVAVRPFERRDRDQLSALVNLHVAAVVPGVVLSVNTVLSQLEREPHENVVDPWADERRCLVATRDGEIVAAALLHRFRGDADVGADYRGAGEIRWLACKVDAAEAGASILREALAQMKAWQVTVIGAECNLPAPACYGVPDTLPHIRSLVLPRFGGHLIAWGESPGQGRCSRCRRVVRRLGRSSVARRCSYCV